jgi:hypothetical protein
LAEQKVLLMAATWVVKRVVMTVYEKVKWKVVKRVATMVQLMALYDLVQQTAQNLDRLKASRLEVLKDLKLVDVMAYLKEILMEMM